MPPAIARYKWVMRIFGVIYLLGALLFFFFPVELLYVINVGPKVFGVTEAISEPQERFWIVMATSMMAMLSAISFLSAHSPKTRGYPMVHLLSKVVSTAGFAYLFLHDKPYFAYLVGIISDSPIALIVLYYMLRITPALAAAESGASTSPATAPGAMPGATS